MGTLCLRTQYLFEVIVACVIFFVGALYLCCFCGADKQKKPVGPLESDEESKPHAEV